MPRQAVIQIGTSGHYSIAEGIKRNTKLRRCKLCKKQLSHYNLNTYCFAHLQEGLDLEDQRRRERIQKANQKERKKRWNNRCKIPLQKKTTRRLKKNTKKQ